MSNDATALDLLSLTNETADVESLIMVLDSLIDEESEVRRSLSHFATTSSALVSPIKVNARAAIHQSRTIEKRWWRMLFLHLRAGTLESQVKSRLGEAKYIEAKAALERLLDTRTALEYPSFDVAATHLRIALLCCMVNDLEGAIHHAWQTLFGFTNVLLLAERPETIATAKAAIGKAFHVLGRCMIFSANHAIVEILCRASLRYLGDRDEEYKAHSEYYLMLICLLSGRKNDALVHALRVFENPRADDNGLMIGMRSGMCVAVLESEAENFAKSDDILDQIDQKASSGGYKCLIFLLRVMNSLGSGNFEPAVNRIEDAIRICSEKHSEIGDAIAAATYFMAAQVLHFTERQDYAAGFMARAKELASRNLENVISDNEREMWEAIISASPLIRGSKVEIRIFSVKWAGIEVVIPLALAS